MTRKTTNSDDMLESVSALMDNDWDDESHINEVLGQIQHPAPGQAQMRRKFERYSLIRDAMHKDLGNNVPADFASRVSAAIAEEPTIVTPVAVSRRGAAVSHIGQQQPHSDARQTSLDKNDGVFWSRFGVGVGGFAVAASAAMVALVGFNVLDQADGSLGPTFGGSPVAAIDVQNQTDDAVPTVTVIDQEQFKNATVQAGFSNNDPNSLEGRAVVNSFNNGTIEYVSNSTTFWVRFRSTWKTRLQPVWEAFFLMQELLATMRSQCRKKQLIQLL